MIALTGATGQLGHLVIESLLKSLPAESLIAAVRTPSKAADLAAKGVQIRQADYTDPTSLNTAFKDVEKLLLISSNEIGQRATQHRNVIDAAKRQNVELLIYTSVLHADSSTLSLAEEHRETERMIKASGIPFIILRNGWYTENYAASIPAAIALAAFYGSAGEGRIASAARADFAEASARALTGAIMPGQILELAGDQSYTLKEFAAELSRQTGKSIPYINLPEDDYRGALLGAGLPNWLATGLASWDNSAAHGALYSDSRQLSTLLGRPTTPFAKVIQEALKH